jgi:hypothetical protein
VATPPEIEGSVSSDQPALRYLVRRQRHDIDHLHAAVEVDHLQ